MWEAKLGPSWSQVGSYKGLKWYVKVTSMLRWFFIEKCCFWTPKGEGRRHGRGTLWRHGNIAFWYQKCNISNGLLTFCEVVPVRAQWRRHLKVTFFRIIITTMWFKCMFTCICEEDLFYNEVSTRRRGHKLKIYAAADFKAWRHMPPTWPFRPQNGSK